MPLFLRYNNYINDYIKFQSSVICKPVSKLEVIYAPSLGCLWTTEN